MFLCNKKPAPPNPSMAAAAADWSQLPKELLHLISQRLANPFYLLRFRSVCSAWRSSVASPVTRSHHFPFTFPPLSATDPYISHLSKRAIFLITPPPPQHTQTQTPWLVKIGKDPTGQTQFYHPLFHDLHLLYDSLSVFDFNHLRVFHLLNEFVLDESLQPLGSNGNSPFMEKVAAAVSPPKDRPLPLIMIADSGELELFSCTDDCSVNPITETRAPYHDLCVFNGRPCAVDANGRTIAVGEDSVLELVAEPGNFLGSKKFLVESGGGELLLVDKSLSCSHSLLDFGWERLRFEVFRLDVEEKRWVRITDLGDRILFLGDHCSFSASASQLRLARGNCVVFRDTSLECDVGVFPLDVGRVSPLSDHPDYSKLFWPPPDWARLHWH